MSNTNNHGGPRPNSGPKPNVQLEHARALIDQAITDQDWIDAWKQIFQVLQTATDPRAKTGAMRLMCKYRFGKPTTNIEHTHTAPQDIPAPVQEENDDEPPYDPTDPEAVRRNIEACRANIFDLEHMRKQGIELRIAHPEINFDPRPVLPAPPVTLSEPDTDTEPITPSPAPLPAAQSTPKRNTNPKPKTRRAHRRHNAKNSTPANKPKHRIPRLTPEQKIQFKAGLAATIQSPRLRAAMGLPPLPAPPQLEQT